MSEPLFLADVICEQPLIYMMDVAGTLYHCKLIAISGLWIGGCVGYLQKEHHMRFMVTIAMNF